MDLLHTEDEGSVIVFDLRLSEAELQYLAIAVEYILKTLDDTQLNAEFVDDGQPETPTEAREFLTETWHELVALLQTYCHPDFLPARFRDVQGDDTSVLAEHSSSTPAS